MVHRWFGIIPMIDASRALASSRVQHIRVQLDRRRRRRRTTIAWLPIECCTINHHQFANARLCLRMCDAPRFRLLSRSAHLQNRNHHRLSTAIWVPLHGIRLRSKVATHSLKRCVVIISTPFTINMALRLPTRFTVTKLWMLWVVLERSSWRSINEIYAFCRTATGLFSPKNQLLID